MRRKSFGSRSSLFLIELILSLLVFALVSTVCIRFFGASWKNRTAAREWNHIQELTVNASEILEAGDGRIEDFCLLFPDGVIKDSGMDIFYDSRWASCDEEHAVYTLQLQITLEKYTKTMDVVFLDKNGNVLYQQEIRYPRNAEQDREGGDPS